MKKNIREYSLTVLGCGSSASTPKLGCIISGRKDCQCFNALNDKYNHRYNPSIVLSRKIMGETPNEYYNLLVDCGKTFREAAIKTFRSAEINHIDACLITHSHMDAMGGLDDLREVQPKDGRALEIFMDHETSDAVKNMYFYLFNKNDAVRKAIDFGNKSIYKNVEDIGKARNLYLAKLRPWLLEEFQTFSVGQNTLDVTPIPMYHGPHCVAQGFVFHEHGSNSQTVYLSDFRCQSLYADGKKDDRGVPILTKEDFDNLTCFINCDETLNILSRFPIKHLFLDALHYGSKRTYISHSSFEETVEVIKVLEIKGFKAEHVWLTGMSCSNDYHTNNKRLLEQFPQGHVKCAYDGLQLHL